MTQNAFVIHPDVKEKRTDRSVEARLTEAKGLAGAIRLNILGDRVVPVREIRPATYIGMGAVADLAAEMKSKDIDVVVMDCSLSPVQQRNLEKEFNAKVIDRTALILEIFGERARTKEGVLQVELAHLTYQRGRLVRSWTHLERQRGGMGFLGGPGETQIEIDRRLIDERLVKIKKELEHVKRTRALHRRARQRVSLPVVALVGYTNAGKSTLFNKLTRADVFAEDLLFATLDPTMRELKLPSGRSVILSDTVGFISNLPTELIAAFRATLEEVLEADLILHVRDVSHPDMLAQKLDVENVLRDLGLGDDVDHGLHEVLNKIDLLDIDERAAIQQANRKKKNLWPLSALTGEGIPELLHHVDEALQENNRLFKMVVPLENGALLAKLYDKGSIVKRVDKDMFACLEVSMSHEDYCRLLEHHPNIRITKE